MFGKNKKLLVLLLTAFFSLSLLSSYEDIDMVDNIQANNSGSSQDNSNGNENSNGS